ncbi:uncharacterized protein LOC123545600 [Mercenaria mercenaria]|uniref:uncharacterized protein LOC123545600 n=1 Tax=Mercenaria mercenaria TaxID=6596 RepID=UPI00234E530F|nr:uncharacterized protein LOC123545600 [Mercenaria mercenaria]
MFTEGKNDFSSYFVVTIRKFQDKDDMACTVDYCVSAIADADVEAFDLFLQKLVQKITAYQRSKGIVKFRWVSDIPVFCTLCNNPEFIVKVGEFRRQLENIYESSIVHCLGPIATVTDLANALKFKECSKELEKLYTRKENDSRIRSDFDLFSAILITGKYYGILVDFGVTVKTLKRLCENGRDIRACGPSGRSVLHEAILHMSPYEVLETIISQYGVSAFSSFMFKVIYYKGRQPEVVKILKLFLYQNPCIQSNIGVIQKTIQYDRIKFPDISEDTFSEDRKNENEAQRHSGKYTHPQEELRLLPWLYKYGFPFSRADRDEIDIPSLFGDVLTYDLDLDQPRQLIDIARIKIRTMYHGSMLHKVLNSIKIPSSVKDYILMKEFD